MTLNKTKNKKKNPIKVPAISKMKACLVPKIKPKLVVLKHMILRGWAQENVEEHSKKNKDDVCHDAQPKARVFEELLVVGAEEDITNGHSS